MTPVDRGYEVPIEVAAVVVSGVTEQWSETPRRSPNNQGHAGDRAADELFALVAA